MDIKLTNTELRNTVCILKEIYFASNRFIFSSCILQLGINSFHPKYMEFL